MKILWLTNYPSPYRVDFFTELSKYVELTVLFENTVEQQIHRNKDWFNTNYSSFEAVFLKQNGLASKVMEISEYALKKKYDIIVLADYSTTASVPIALRLIFHSIKYAISIDGAYLRSRHVIKDAVKQVIIKNAQFYLSSSDTSDQYLLHYGAKAENIYRYNFTSLRDADIMKRPLEGPEKREKREKLGIANTVAALFVGRFTYIKGIDFLLKNAKKFEGRVDFYIAGDLPTQEYMDMVRQYQLKNIHFIGFQKKEKLKEYYMACDLLVFPTRYDPWGLVVNEAMSCAMAIISTDKSSAALHFIKNGNNGYVYPVDNDELYTSYLEQMCADKNTLRKMGKRNLALIQDYSIEKMVNQHIEIFKKYI